MSDTEFSHQKTLKVVTPTGDLGGSGARTYSGDGLAELKPAIADSETNKLIEIAFPAPAGGLKSLVLSSDQDVTLYINDLSTGTPHATIALVAGEPYSWDENSLDTCKITVDTTAVYCTNASGSTANVNISAVYDGTT